MFGPNKTENARSDGAPDSPMALIGFREIAVARNERDNDEWLLNNHNFTQRYECPVAKS